MDQPDLARGGGGGADGLEPVLVHAGGQAVHHRDQPAAPGADQVAEQRVQEVLAEQAVRQGPDVEDQLAPAPPVRCRPALGTRPVMAAQMSMKSP